MPPLPPAGCWRCGALPTEEDLSLRAVLRPRAEAEGGPYTSLACGSCGTATVVLDLGGDGPVLAPPEAVGLDTPVIAALLDGEPARRDRRRAREWVARFGRAFRAPSTPRPRPPRARAAPPPPPARPPRRPQASLPRTAAEAREILGVAAGASRKDVDAAFRRGSRKCHPDLVAHLDEDFQRLAHEKFLRLKRAHEILGGAAGQPPPAGG